MVETYFTCDICESVGQSEEYRLESINFFRYNLQIICESAEINPELERNIIRQVCRSCRDAANTSLRNSIFPDIPLEG